MRTHIVTGYSYTIESLLQAVHKGLAIEFVDVETNPATRRSRLFRSTPHFLIQSTVTILRVSFMFRPLHVLVCLSAALAMVGVAPIARFLWAYAFGSGDGHLQSLILGAAVVVLAGLILVAGLIADLIAHNRRLLEMTLELVRRSTAADRPPALRDKSAASSNPPDSPVNPPVLQNAISAHCGGFTMIELMTVLAVISILIGLLLPAVQAAREAARRTQCRSQLKQITLGVHSFHSIYGRFPSNGWGYAWMAEPGRGVGPKQPGGWIYQLLPQVDAANVWNIGKDTQGEVRRGAIRRVCETPLPLFKCPSRPGNQLGPPSDEWSYRNSQRPTIVARTDYAINEGDYITGTPRGPSTLSEGDNARYVWTDVRKATGVSWLRGAAKFSDITDGTSNTYLVGEKYVSTEGYFSPVDAGYDQSMYSGVDIDIARWTLRPPVRDGRLSPDLVRVFGSAHGQSCSMGMCDGSVRDVTYSIHPDVHRMSGNRHDGIK